MSDDERRKEIFAKKPDERTVAEVDELRTKWAIQGGCCDRFVEQTGCDCMQRARVYEARRRRPPEPTYPLPAAPALGHSGEKYVRKIRSCRTRAVLSEPVDVYSVLDAFGPLPAPRAHAAKKILCAGLRDKASAAQDIREAIDALKEDLKQLEAGE